MKMKYPKIIAKLELTCIGSSKEETSLLFFEEIKQLTIKENPEVHVVNAEHRLVSPCCYNVAYKLTGQNENTLSKTIAFIISTVEEYGLEVKRYRVTNHEKSQ